MKFRNISLTTVLLVSAVGTSAAYAIPADYTGAVPPEQTSEPTKPDPNCDQSYANDPAKTGDPLLFGVYGRNAGDLGTKQDYVTVAENLDKRDVALAKLKGKKHLRVRLNRLFMSLGDKGIADFKKMADRLGKKGFEIDVAVRYHPSEKDNGNMKKWIAFVKKTIKAFGPNKHVTSFEITNELNVKFTKNTSDGYYKNAELALAKGVIAAKETSKKYGYDHQKIGFDLFWRVPIDGNDSEVWTKIGKLGGKKLVAATDWVGLHITPGTWFPGFLLQADVVSYKDVILEALAQTRECFMPMAGFGKSTPIRINEAGYPDGPGRSEATQLDVAKQFLDTANSYSGTYNVEGLMWFTLRDNNSSSPSFQSYWGLLKDDYTSKPVFDVYKDFIAKHGA